MERGLTVSSGNEEEACMTHQKCPCCGQPLVNTEAVNHLRLHDARITRELKHAQRQGFLKGRAEPRPQDQARIEQLTARLDMTESERRSLRERLAAREERRARRDELQKEALREEGRKELRGELKASYRKVADLTENLRLAQRRAESLGNTDRSELQEGSLYDQIRARYPSDDVKRIGRRGADLHARVCEPGRAPVDPPIVISCKDTGHFNTHEFLDQAKENARDADTPYVMLVTSAYPKRVRGPITERDGVLIVKPEAALGLYGALRMAVLLAARDRATAEATAGKTSKILAFFRSEEFRRSLADHASHGRALTALLDQEERSHQNLWKKRRDFYHAIAKAGTWWEDQVPTTLEGRMSKPRHVRLNGPMAAAHG